MNQQNKWPWWQIDLTGLAFAAAATLAVLFAGVHPLIKARDHVKGQVSTLASRRKEASDLTASLTSVQKQLERTRQELEASSLNLQDASVLNERLALVNDLAFACGLQINAIQPGRRFTGSHHHTVSIFVSGNGTYRRCAQFLHRLREKFPDTAVSSFDLAGGFTKAAQFRFDLDWYVAPSDAT